MLYVVDLRSQLYTRDELKKVARTTDNYDLLSSLLADPILIIPENIEGVTITKDNYIDYLVSEHSEYCTIDKEIFDIIYNRKDELVNSQNPRAKNCLGLMYLYNLFDDMTRDIEIKECKDSLHISCIIRRGISKDNFDYIWENRKNWDTNILSDLAMCLHADLNALNTIVDEINTIDPISRDTTLLRVGLHPNTDKTLFDKVRVQTVAMFGSNSSIEILAISPHSTLEMLKEVAYTDGEHINIRLLEKPNITDEMIEELRKIWGFPSIDFNKISCDLYQKNDFSAYTRDYVFHVLAINNQKLNEEHVINFIKKCFGDNQIDFYLNLVESYNEIQETYSKTPLGK